MFNYYYTGVFSERFLWFPHPQMKDFFVYYFILMVRLFKSKQESKNLFEFLLYYCYSL